MVPHLWRQVYLVIEKHKCQEVYFQSRVNRKPVSLGYLHYWRRDVYIKITPKLLALLAPIIYSSSIHHHNQPPDISTACTMYSMPISATPIQYNNSSLTPNFLYSHYFLGDPIYKDTTSFTRSHSHLSHLYLILV